MDDLEFIIERKILHIGNHVIAVRNRDLRGFGLTSSQSEALLFIARNEGTSIVALKRHLGVSHQAVQKTVGRLRERGLVRVAVSEDDARVKSVTLLPEGARLCEELKKAGAMSGHSIMSRLDEGERRRLLELLSKLEVD